MAPFWESRRNGSGFIGGTWGLRKNRNPHHPAFPSEAVCVKRCWQVFGLAGRLLAPASQSRSHPWLDLSLSSASVGAFVPVYRCGAVPEVRRIPFSGEPVTLTTRSKIDYIVSARVGQCLYVVVCVEIWTRKRFDSRCGKSQARQSSVKALTPRKARLGAEGGARGSGGSRGIYAPERDAYNDAPLGANSLRD